jgi:hypothetical protein
MGSERRVRGVCLAQRVGVLVAAGFLTLTCVAHAEPSSADKEVARKAMGEGRDKREASDLKGALAAFEKAHEIMNVPSTGIEVARTQQKMGLLKEAYETAQAVTKIPVAAKEPAPFAAARVDAQKMADELATKIPSLNIKLSDTTEGVQATTIVDGATVAPDARKAFHVNPGDHTVVAKLSDGTEKTEKVTVKEGETKEIVFSFKKEIKEDKEAHDAPPPTEEPQAKSKFLRPMPLTGFAIAGIGLVAGTVTGAIAISKASSAKGDCFDDVHCGPVTHDSIRLGRKMATVSNVSFAVAGVGAAIAVVGLLTGPSKPKPAADDLSKAKLFQPKVTPWVGVGSAGLAGTF